MKKIIIPLMLILMSITTIHAVDLDNKDLQELHELEDKMSVEMYGMSFDELKADSNNTFISIQGSIWYEQRINNVELAVQNYLMVHGEVKE